MDEMIALVSESYAVDELKQRVPADTSRPVWANIQSVTRSEFFAAGKSGLEPELVAVIPLVNYGGERVAVVRGQTYAVYRTFVKEESDDVELYLQRKEGLQ